MPASEAKKLRERLRYHNNPEPKKAASRNYRKTKKFAGSHASEPTEAKACSKTTRKSSLHHLVAVAEPKAVEPVSSSPVVAELEATEPVMAEPEAAEPVMAEPEAAEPEAAEPEAAEPEAAEPEAAEPEVAEPDAEPDAELSSNGTSSSQGDNASEMPFQLSLSFQMLEEPSMNQVRFDSNVHHFPSHFQTSDTPQGIPKAEAFPPLVIFQLAVTLGLSGLATFLQYEFYHEHDVLPGYAWPLAIAGAVGMLSLASMKFAGVWTDRARKFLYGACYVFMVLSSSFHVADKAWDDAAKVPMTDHANGKADSSPAADRALNAMTDALKQATKNRAWNVMETMGVHVSKQIVPKTSVQQPKPFGITRDWVIGIGAVIIIVLRALLEGIQALTAIAVRNYLATRYSR
ncbi:MAG TPA: hypothetical protein VE954_27505 [Oligoflexus sp.]|uniref:hypothetical protein n=1 Tax=Oligoflexus sp. TaxID=1971216 RepID=UPI002D2BF052|nr:hypothetical protein [Oligoflexus sp.]HYX36872.1 hypothetical protein [Oligoflexus sp.]